LHFSASRLLALIACIIFILATFGVTVGAVLLVPLGLAFLAAAFVVP
jgi:hypothetical protein